MTHANLSKWLTAGGQIVSRYGLVVVLAWIGFGKYARWRPGCSSSTAR
ncbi:MAG: hypothetical protein QOC90_2298 [Mycobacterium sp.]|nr:hypothetical protein [Mycobacterium sp.]